MSDTPIDIREGAPDEPAIEQPFEQAAEATERDRAVVAAKVVQAIFFTHLQAAQNVQMAAVMTDLTLKYFSH